MPVDTYGTSYGNYSSELYRAIRHETYGEGVHGTGWLTADEQDRFLAWLPLDPSATVLDVACGSGGPALRVAERTGCRVRGVDIHTQAVDNANAAARSMDLAGRAEFIMADAGRPLPFPAESFDAITCIDSINHLPDRPCVLAEWHRLLKPGGRLLFTDPIVVTGPLSNEEIAVRSSIGFFLFVPPGDDERLLNEAGFSVLEVVDATDNMAQVAGRWGAARARREVPLREIEGDGTYEGQQRFFEVATRIATERRLSRFVYLALKSGTD